MTIGPGSRVGPYEVTALLGEGGMGKVWRARHSGLHRDDALKVLPEAFAADPDRLARFEREAQVLASFNHSNIAHVYGLEQSEGVRALVMELVEGPTLADRIVHGALPVGEALAIARQIADALEAAHDKGIVHRDLKPANVKVRPDGTVKVLDFGLAKALEPVASQTPRLSQSPTITSPAMTGQGVILGTAAYMSPEQASGAQVDQRSDIWAFGCVLYEMLTGKPVFSGDSVARVLAKVLEREPELSALPASTPSNIRRLIRRCLEKDARRRLHHIADARLDIEDGDDIPVASSTSSPAPSTKRSPVALWVIPALLVGAAGASAAWAVLVPRWRVPAPVVRSIVATLSPEDAATASFRGLAISPDGRQVVYGVGKTLHLRAMHEIRSQPLNGSEGALSPVFSPDGRSVAFFVPSESVIKRLAVTGGRASIVANTDGQPRGLSWGVDGTIVYATTTSAGLWRVSAAGGEPERLTTVDQKEALYHTSPSMLPNGRAVLFSAFRGASSRVGLVALDTRRVTYPIDVGGFPRFVPTGHIVYLEGTVLRAIAFDPQRLVLTGTAPVTLAEELRTRGSSIAPFDLTADGSLVYLPAEPTPQTTMVWVGPDGREDSIGLPARLHGMPRVSPDGTRIVSDIRSGGRSEVWVSDLRRPGWTRVATLQQGTGHWFPKWTPDGTRLVFAVYHDAPRAPGLVWVPADGSGTMQPLLTVEDSQFIDARYWSRDGQSLFFTYGNPTLQRTGLLSIPSAGNGKPAWKPLIERTEGALAGPQSPDGRWLVTESPDAAGVPSLYIERFPELRDRQQVSSDGGGRYSVWSPDGRDLYYRRMSDLAMMAVSIQTTPVLAIGTPRVLFLNRGYLWSGDSRPWDVAPDGRFLMLKEGPSQQTIESRQLILVQSWSRELRSIAAN